MEITKNIETIEKALWLRKEKTLVMADLHIGYEEALNKKGILIPRTQFKETEKELKEILAKIKPKTIAINGDLKHEFGEISQQEWHETLEILDLLQKYCRKIVLVKGNHDIILGPIAKKRNLKIVDYYCLGDVCILHGDKIINDLNVNSAKILIIGHEHPAISLREGMKQEIYKCFLFGQWHGKKLIVMPSFLPIVEGTDLKKEKLLSPFLRQNLGSFDVFVIGDKVYKFGKLKDIK